MRMTLKQATDALLALHDYLLEDEARHALMLEAGARAGGVDEAFANISHWLDEAHAMTLDLDDSQAVARFAVHHRPAVTWAVLNRLARLKSAQEGQDSDS